MESKIQEGGGALPEERQFIETKPYAFSRGWGQGEPKKKGES